MDELSKDKLETLLQDIKATINKLDPEKLIMRRGELETKSLEEDFWKDNLKASKIMAEISNITDILDTSNNLLKTCESLIELFNSLNESEVKNLQADFEDLLKNFHNFETLQFLSGKYDFNSVIMSIHAGQGGTESNDWVEMLLRMYTRYFEKKKWKFELQHLVPGNETGFSTITGIVTGQYAYGLLKGEAGTHRLVRLSPFNSQNLRQTTFAGVEIMPVIDDNEIEINIPEKDLEIKAVRASGPGGQHVNKTSSAVQIKHLPSGIMVHCSEQRSQSQNKDTAMQILKSKLWKIEEDKRLSEMKDLKGEHKIVGWGNQIRNYVLHPYQLVKDLRTGIETSNTQAVLDGDLDEFIDAELRLFYIKK